MSSIENKTLEDLKKEYKDIFENPAIFSLIELKIKGDRELILGGNPENYPKMSEEEYVRRFEENLPKIKEYLTKKKQPSSFVRRYLEDMGF